MNTNEERAAQFVGDVARGLGFGTRRPSAEDMIDAAMGPRGMAIARLPVARSSLSKVGGEWTIFLDPRLPATQMRWRLAHHFSEWLLAQDGVVGVEADALRSPVAAEIILAHDVAARAVGRVAFVDLAARLNVPTTAMLLREAEVARVPTVLLAQGRRGTYARVRGDDSGRLPLEIPALELLASRRGIGVKRYPVPEDFGVVLRLVALLLSHLGPERGHLLHHLVDNIRRILTALRLRRPAHRCATGARLVCLGMARSDRLRVGHRSPDGLVQADACVVGEAD